MLADALSPTLAQADTDHAAWQAAQINRANFDGGGDADRATGWHSTHPQDRLSGTATPLHAQDGRHSHAYPSYCTGAEQTPWMADSTGSKRVHHELRTAQNGDPSWQTPSMNLYMGPYPGESPWSARVNEWREDVRRLSALRLVRDTDNIVMGFGAVGS